MIHERTIPDHSHPIDFTRSPYRAHLGYGMNISMGAIRYRFSVDSEFEGAGITPDA
jgi:hypothetical protein